MLGKRVSCLVVEFSQHTVATNPEDSHSSQWGREEPDSSATRAVDGGSRSVL